MGEARDQQEQATAELDELADHPRTQNDEQHHRDDQFRDIGKRHFLNLRRYLDDADQNAHDQNRT